MCNYTILNIKMKNSFSLQQVQKTSNLNANLISRQYKLYLMADFMRIKYENPKMKQSQTANQLSYSTSTLQRFRNDINMFSPYRFHPNNTNKRAKKAPNTNIDNNSICEPDVERPQLNSNDLKTISNEPVRKNKLKGGANSEIDEKYLDEIVHNNYR